MQSTALHLRAAQRDWIMHRTAHFDALWESMTQDTFAQDERLPYWTEVWPASLALADWLYECRTLIAGQKCIDMGCGLGLTALVGRWLGARVAAFDYEMQAMRCALHNAAANALLQPLWLCMDWRRPAVARACATHIWGADIMYEARFAAPIVRFLEHALAPNGRVWIAEPGRTVYDVFRRHVHEGGWRVQQVYECAIEPHYAQNVRVTTRIWELQKD